jgi:hypothetical protein
VAIESVDEESTMNGSRSGLFLMWALSCGIVANLFGEVAKLTGKIAFNYFSLLIPITLAWVGVGFLFSPTVLSRRTFRLTSLKRTRSKRVSLRRGRGRCDARWREHSQRARVLLKFISSEIVINRTTAAACVARGFTNFWP